MEFAHLILQFITQGGSAAVIAVLAAVIAGFIWDRKALTKNLEDTTQKVYDSKDSEARTIREIVDRYHQGNLDLVQALNEIKIVLVSIQNTRR